MPESNIDFIRRYFDAVEAGVSPEELAGFFTPDVILEEFPNRLEPKGVRRGLQEILDASVQGRRVIVSQRHEILHAITEGDEIAVEVRWSGVLGMAMGSLDPGATVRARLAIFLRLSGGRIARQRNYGCFDAF